MSFGVPVKDIIVGKTVLMEKRSEHLPQVQIVWLGVKIYIPAMLDILAKFI